MLFNSYIFIFVFLPVTLIVFFTLSRFRLIGTARIWLILASLFFYGYWAPSYLILMLISIVFNYQIGAQIAKAELFSKRAKILLWTGIIINVVAIGYFKYANFFLSSVNSILGSSFSLGEIILPLGISFYTFTQIAYLVDTYKGETKDTKCDLVTYTLFVTFFPPLISGPILRHDELIPYLRQLKTFKLSQQNIALGLTLFSLGLAKKVLIADNVSPWVGPVFANAGEVSFIEAWVGALAYTFQLYFDFSGYTDMAIGVALMFNIRLPINFNSPYKADSISDFWRRWHITLSNFLRDYLYIPLGGSRKGDFRRYANLITTMLLGGLWHGAGWTYVIWGGLHGLYLSINHGWRKLNLPLPKFLAWLITFISVIVGWVLFRAVTWQDAFNILKSMAGLNGLVIPGQPNGKLSFLTGLGIELKPWSQLEYLPEVYGSRLATLGVVILLTFAVTYLPNTQEIIHKLKPTWKWAAAIGLLTSLSLLSLNRVSEFLYFQF